MQPKPKEEQISFITRNWNNWRWRLFFKLFFSRFMLGRFGRDPEMLKEVSLHVGDFILRRSIEHLSSVDCQHNGFLRYIVHGAFGNDLPHYAKEENFEIIRKNLGALHLFRGFAEDAAKEGRIDYFNLSNIFEYMNRGLFRSTGEKLLESAVSGGRLAYWNLMVPRRLSDHFPDRLNSRIAESTLLMQRDKGFFYNRFVLEEIR